MPKFKFAPDSLLEGAGFELLVPLPSRTCPEPYRSALTLRNPEGKRGSPEELCGAIEAPAGSR
ncbi:MAG TPA: hypothetical protein VGK96_16300, partial [Candidatus Sulfotelmatobacter sp.]